jgi:hypothetical protein
MQLKLTASIILFLFLQYGCKQKDNVSARQTQTDSTEEQSFFPVTQYLRGQLREIDSLPVTPLKIISINGKEDSIWMKKEDIRPFAEPFLHPLIDSANLKRLFVTKSFLDQTINAFTFSYDPIDKLPDTLQLRRWDVYIDPQKNTVTRIYIVKEINNNGTLQTIQLTWKSNQWCKIATITEQPNKQQDIKEETMKWDFSE